MQGEVYPSVLPRGVDDVEVVVSSTQATVSFRHLCKNLKTPKDNMLIVFLRHVAWNMCWDRVNEFIQLLENLGDPIKSNTTLILVLVCYCGQNAMTSSGNGRWSKLRCERREREAVQSVWCIAWSYKHIYVETRMAKFLWFSRFWQARLLSVSMASIMLVSHPFFFFDCRNTELTYWKSFTTLLFPGDPWLQGGVAWCQIDSRKRNWRMVPRDGN